MRLMVFTDVHWSLFSSIIRSRGEKYSSRIENLIRSMNWVESLALSEKCDTIVCCGDFFDSAELNAEELSALQEIKWSGLNHVWIVGNHEISRGSLEFSSQHLFKLCPNSVVIDKPFSAISADNPNTEICFLPYINSYTDKSSIRKFFPSVSSNATTRIVFSHNDIKGIQYGGFLSQDGFEIEDIESFCNLFVNGHLHNGEKITDRIINLGNLSGQNFSENAERYAHLVGIVDTNTLKIDYFENPHAFNLYKYTIVSKEKLNKFLSAIKGNAVVTFKCPEELLKDATEIIEGCPSIVEKRVLLEMKSSDKVEEEPTINSLAKTDHVQAFNEYILTTLGSSDIIKAELVEVSK